MNIYSHVHRLANIVMCSQCMQLDTVLKENPKMNKKKLLKTVAGHMLVNLKFMDFIQKKHFFVDTKISTAFH